MVISKTPLRCSFFGGGTDFRDYFENTQIGYGSVISTALDMYVYITVNKRFDDMVRIVYSGNELVNHVSEVKHNIIREALQLVGIENGIEVIYTADIPMSNAGVGLASSSALAVGVLNALNAYKCIHKSAEELARMACEIEIDRIGQQIGIQDQFTVSYGGFNRYRFNRDDSVAVMPVVCRKETLDRLKDSLMLFFTGNTRDSHEIMNEQNKNISERMDTLDQLTQTVDRVYEALCNGEVDEWGYELDMAWLKKKMLSSGITNERIDGMYQSAKLAGALGGKILGAGGGGFMLFYVPIEKQSAVKKALSNFRQVPFNFESQGSQIIFFHRNTMS